MMPMMLSRQLIKKETQALASAAIALCFHDRFLFHEIADI